MPNNLQGRALALATVGQPIALSLVVPLGTLLGRLFEWQCIFGIISACTLVLIIWVLAISSYYPALSAAQSQPIGKIFMMPGVLPVLFVLFFGDIGPQYPIYLHRAI
ncbi:hypothetical protein BK708_11815 [Bacillus thuringiensis serovar yunnanensis]|nr:hypothetical protein BK708_11815 [Bacillus thuringiensis serovar yunnanensis]